MKKKIEKIVCDFCGEECNTKCDMCGRDVCSKHYFTWTWDVYRDERSRITINKICNSGFNSKDDSCMNAFNKFRTERKKKYAD